MTDHQPKILFVSSNFPPILGGSSVVYSEICRNAGGRVVALASASHPETGQPMAGAAEYDAACGYPIHRVKHLRPPSTAKRNGNWGRLRGFLGTDLPIMLRTLAAVMCLALRYRAKTVCLGELVYLGWLTFPLRYLFGRTVIIYTHGEEISQESAGMASNMREACLKHASRVVSVSLFCKSLIVSKYRVDPSRILVLSNGIDTARFTAGPARREVFPASIRHKKIILSVSRLVERKGQDRLIAAMPEILRAAPDAHCVIVGEGPLAATLDTLAEDAGVASAVTFMGKVSGDALAELYRAADLFALPCRTLPDGDTEGYGLVFLEAGACGAPVIAGAAGGTVEAVVDGETGLIVNGNAPEDIAEAVIRVFARPDLARRLAAGARRLAADKDWSQVARSFVRLSEKDAPAAPVVSFDRRSAVPALEATTRPRLLLTVDAEEQFSWSTFARSGHSVGGLEELKGLHRAARSLGISPVYLATYAMLTDAGFSAFFQDVLEREEAEIGLHLHSWITPPYWEEPNVFNSYQCNLPPHILRRKLETMIRLFEQKFGLRPRLHRAGRWGSNAETNALLAEMGFEVDLSPSTGYCDTINGGPDFTNLDGRPFWADGSALLTIPASSLNYVRGPNFLSAATFRRNFVPGTATTPKLLTGKAVRFSPEGQPVSRLKAMARQFVKMRLPIAVSTIHSTSLYAAGNPYAADHGEADALMNRTVELLDYCVGTLGMRPATCRELFEEASAGRQENRREVERAVG